jgi:hypothetical protein
MHHQLLHPFEQRHCFLLGPKSHRKSARNPDARLSRTCLAHWDDDDTHTPPPCLARLLDRGTQIELHMQQKSWRIWTLFGFLETRNYLAWKADSPHRGTLMIQAETSTSGNSPPSGIVSFPENLAFPNSIHSDSSLPSPSSSSERPRLPITSTSTTNPPVLLARANAAVHSPSQATTSLFLSIIHSLWKSNPNSLSTPGPQSHWTSCHAGNGAWPDSPLPHRRIPRQAP